MKNSSKKLQIRDFDTLGRLLKKAEKLLYKEKIKTPFLDALILLSFITKKKKEFILAHPELKIKRNLSKKFYSLINLRKKHYPLAYILSKKEFFKYNFFVNEDVLIPRPETEKIVEMALKYIKDKNKKYKILDLGTGSGCIAISLAKELTKNKINFEILATDISKKALTIAKINKKRLKAKNIKFVKSNLFEKINEKFDLILANLPYLKEKEIKNELLFEPKIALKDNGSFKKFLKLAPLYLKNKGIIIFETKNGKIKRIFGK